MRLLYIILLTSCAAMHVSCAACVRMFTDGKPAHLLRPNQAQTWEELQARCAAEFPGQTLLQDAEGLNETERVACGQGVVPFGVYAEYDQYATQPPFWDDNLQKLVTDHCQLYWNNESSDLVKGLDLAKQIRVAPCSETGVAAIDLQTGQWSIVSTKQTFECALCQKPMTKFNNFYRQNYYPDELSEALRQIYFEIVLNYTVTDGDRTTCLSNLHISVEDELVDLFANSNATVEFSHYVFDSAGCKELHYNLYSKTPLDFEVINTTSIVNLSMRNGYKVTRFRMVSPCPVDDFPEGFQIADPSEIFEDRDPRIHFIGVQALVNPETEILSVRQCIWDQNTSALIWAPRSDWRVVLKNCTSDEKKVEDKFNTRLVDLISAKRLEKQLESLTEKRLDCTDLEEVADILKEIILMDNDVSDMILSRLYSILENYIQIPGSDFCLLDRKRFHLVVSDLEPDQPVLGFAVMTPSTGSETPSTTDLPSFNIANTSDNVHDSYFGTGEETQSYSDDNNDAPFEQISASQTNKSPNLDLTTCEVLRNTTNTTDLATEFAVTVSEDLIAKFQQLAAASVARRVQSSTQETQEETYERIVYVQLITKNSLGSVYLGDNGYFVEFTYQNINESIRKGERMITECSSWNPLTKSWTTLACRERKVSQDSITVCRCWAKHMTQNGDVWTGTFAMKRAFKQMDKTQDPLQSNLYTYISVYSGLFGFTVVVLLFAMISLLSFVLTLIFYKKWRKDVCNKIAFNLVIALTVNLALGLSIDFVYFDTESVGCIVVGVLRHYSFLAMFLWMLVLSGLQMKRLMSVEDLKVTSHLILKAGLFAWCIPLLPIIILLAWNTRIYRSDHYDRGYCYPEGLFFLSTIQAPAGLIILVNIFIFVAILGHILECYSSKKTTTNSKDERAQQIRQITPNVFIFFLSGFAWVLHYFAEERLVKSDFLFEYLFLMTVTTHISVLALFFIVLNDEARAFWWRAVSKRTFSG